MLLAPPMLLAYLLTQTPSPCALTLEPKEIRPGDSVLLTWSCPTTPRVRLEPGGMILSGKYQVTLRPGYTTTYRVFDAAPNGPQLGLAEVRVTPGLALGEPARICAFVASAKAILPGEPVVLRWECAGSAKVRLEPGGLELDGKSEVTVTPLENTRYTITANNAAGGQSRTLEVSVLGHLSPTAATPAAVCTFEANKTVVKRGEQVDLRWFCQGDAKVRLEPGGLELDGKSSIAVVPDKTTVYTLSVSNLLGGSSRSLEVRVEEPRLVLSEKDLEAHPEEITRPLERQDLAEALARGETLRAAAPEGSWTLRLVVSGRADGLKQVARAAGTKSQEILILPFVRRDGLRFWQACFGTYPSWAAAAKAWRSAPETLRKTYKDAMPQRMPRGPEKAASPE